MKFSLTHHDGIKIEKMIEYKNEKIQKISFIRIILIYSYKFDDIEDFFMK